MSQNAYTPSGAFLGRVTGWDGDVPIIDFSAEPGQLPGPTAIDSAPDQDTGRSGGTGGRSEALPVDASPRTRGLEPATLPDPAPPADGGASPS